LLSHGLREFVTLPDHFLDVLQIGRRQALPTESVGPCERLKGSIETFQSPFAPGLRRLEVNARLVQALGSEPQLARCFPNTRRNDPKRRVDAREFNDYTHDVSLFMYWRYGAVVVFGLD
jgi:hypothetical protein